jgi:phage minor structural protein
MYKIYHNDKLIYSPRSPDVTLGKAELTQQANCAGAIQIIMYPQNPAYKSVKEMASIITVKEDDETIYEGRITTINDEISLEKTLQTEGALAYLNDSVIRPFSFSGDVSEFVEKILKEHNSQVEEGKQILVGDIGVKAALKITAEEYTTAMQQLQSQLPGILGGYLEIRYKNGKKYLDYLEKRTLINTQVIEYGENMVDLSDQKAGSDIATVLIPLGAKDKNQKRITIEKVNDGKDYLTNDEAVVEYGKIVRTVVYDDITSPTILKQMAEKELPKYATRERTIELTAADLAAAGYNIRSFAWGQKVRCHSRVHGIDTTADITTKKTDLCNPANSRITVGDAKPTYTAGSKAETKKDLEETKKELVSSITQARTDLKDDLDNAAGLFQTTITQDNGSTIYYLHDKKTLERSTLVLKMNAKALGVSLDGGNTYSWGFDFDGNAILNEIYAIGLNANKLKTGCIIANDKNGNEVFYLNVETGEVRIGADCVKINSEKIVEYINGVKKTAENAKSSAGEALKAAKATVASMSIEYYKSTSATELKGGTWQSGAVTATQGYYIWSRTKTTAQDGTVTYGQAACITGNTGATGAKGDTGAAGEKGDTGAAGKGVRSIVPQYYLSTSKTAQTGGSWSNTQPSWQPNHYLWTRSYITWSDNTASTTTPILAQALNDANQKGYDNAQNLETIKKTVTKQGSSLETMETQIKEKVWKEDITTEVKKISVGGRNLAESTNQGVTGWSWGMQTGGCTLSEVVENNVRTCKLLRDSVAQTGWSVIYYNHIGRYKWEPDTVYTVSVDVKPSVSTNFNIAFREANGTNNLIISGEKSIQVRANKWNKMIWNVKTASTLPTSTSQVFYATEMNSGTGVWYQFKNLKIEKGNQATDWTPAPEDIDGAVDQAQSTADQVSTKVTTVTTQVESLKTATEALSKAMQSYVKEDELETYKKQVESQLSQTPDAIEARFKTVEQNISKVGSSSDDKWAQLETYIRLTQSGIALGKSDSPITLEIRNDRICFVQSGQMVAYYTNNQLYNSNLVVTTTANILGLIFTKSGRHLQIS